MQADSTIVASKVSGYLRDVQASDNQPVKAGQLLASIDDRDYIAALDQAKADVGGAQAEINNLNASLDQQQAVIAQARDTVDLDQANLTYAQQSPLPTNTFFFARRPLSSASVMSSCSSIKLLTNFACATSTNSL